MFKMSWFVTLFLILGLCSCGDPTTEPLPEPQNITAQATILDARAAADTGVLRALYLQEGEDGAALPRTSTTATVKLNATSETTINEDDQWRRVRLQAQGTHQLLTIGQSTGKVQNQALLQSLGTDTPCPTFENGAWVLRNARVSDSSVDGGREGTATVRVDENGVVTAEITWDDGQKETRILDVDPSPFEKIALVDVLDEVLSAEVPTLTDAQIQEAEKEGVLAVGNFKLVGISTFSATKSAEGDREKFGGVIIEKGHEYYTSHYFSKNKDMETPKEAHATFSVLFNEAKRGSGLTILYQHTSLKEDCPTPKPPAMPIILEGCVGQKATWNTPRAGSIVQLQPNTKTCVLTPNDGETPGTFLISDGVGFKGQGDLYLTLFNPDTLLSLKVDGMATTEKTLMVPVADFGTHSTMLELELQLPEGRVVVGVTVDITEDTEGLNSVQMTITSAVQSP